MTDRVLTLRDLNRALLARHYLLERVSKPVLNMLESLAGMQAQIPNSPYIGLWSRLDGFTRDDFAALILDRKVVKATLMRGTLHFFTAADYLRFRATIQPVLTAFHEMLLRDRNVTVDPQTLIIVGEKFLSESPRTFKEISAVLSALYPHTDVGAMRQAVRMMLPLVQVPDNRQWSYPGSPKFALADDWLGEPIPTEDRLPEFIRRYLAAFGPASVGDFQTWSGLPRMKEVFDGLRDELVTYRDERDRELFDLPNAPLPDPDTPAPVRFLGQLDNLLIGHEDRDRVVRYEYRAPIMKVNAQGSITYLVDGWVRGTATVEKAKKAAALLLHPFEPISKADQAAVIAEGEGLIRFMEPDAVSYEVRFAD